MGKTALITGITGQDGSFLAELLLEKGYEVHGIIRRSSSFNTGRIDHLYHDIHEEGEPLHLHYGDLCDSSSLRSILLTMQVDEVYNLGAQSHVQVSFKEPEYTCDAVALGALRLLDAVREAQGGQGKSIRYYQASSSEMYGKVRETPQSETTPFHPRSPYACAKVYAYWQTVNYREAYGMHCSNGILFNHESERRGETFVTRKITRAATRIALGLQQTLFLGNIDSKRDWGYAKDYVEAMWLMLQQEQGDDYVVATGETHSVREFVELSFRTLGIHLTWHGRGVDEHAIVSALDDDAYAPQRKVRVGEVVVRVDSRYFRPAEVDLLLGDPGKAKRILGWHPRTDMTALAEIMIAHDHGLARKELRMAED